jgi:hypothetical protein
VVIAVINNPNTPVSVIENLTRDLVSLTRQEYNERVVEAIASNPKTPPHILKRLTGEEFTRAYRVARFRDFREGADNSYKKALIKIDEATAVREMERLSRINTYKVGPDSCESILFVLVEAAEIKTANVGLLIAKNPNTPEDLRKSLLESLLTFHNPQVRQAAREIKLNPPTPLKGIDEDDSINLPEVSLEIRLAVAAYLETPPEVLKRLTGDKSPEVRANVASHPCITEEIIEILAKDTVFVKKALARNPLTPPHILERLADDSLLHLEITENPNTPQKLRNQLLINLIQSAQKLLKDRLLYDQSSIREKIDTLVTIFINPHTPPEILTRLILEGKLSS